MIKNIIFIGAGKLGTSLARALGEHGFKIPYFISNNFPKDHKKYLPNTLFSTKFNAVILQNSDVFIIAVPDDQINVVVNRLELLDVHWNKKLILHTSGCLSSAALSLLNSKGAYVGSIHPMQTFDKCFLPPEIFRAINLAVEGDKEIIKFVKLIAELLKAKVLQLKPEEKVLYHMAGVGSSNFFVALLDYVRHLYKELGFEDNKIKELLLPIVNQTIINFNKNESKDILTGPLKRNDLGTIKNHVKYLNDNQKEMLPLYAEISKYISQFILNNKKSEIEELKRILKND